jgi:prophage antirepressor-like protein
MLVKENIVAEIMSGQFRESAVKIISQEVFVWFVLEDMADSYKFGMIGKVF